jgi:phosphoribosylamine--glycine ligase
MIVKNEPYLIEYNVRMGDPECQTILPKLKTDINEIFLACCEEELNNVNIEWTDKKSLCIVVCSKGYPEEFKKNIEIKNLSKIKLDQDEYLFHAGTIDKESRVFAVGGRVLNFISLSENLTSARDKVINKIDKLNWDEGFYRKDIGYKVIDE